MKISDIRASLQRLAERLDNQWAYARSDAEMDIAAGRAEYNDDGERLPTEPEISYYGMIAAFETLGGEWKRQNGAKKTRHPAGRRVFCGKYLSPGPHRWWQ